MPSLYKAKDLPVVIRVAVGSGEKMFARFASVIRPLRNTENFHRCRGSGWSRNTWRKYRLPLTSVAGAIGTVAVYKLTTLASPFVDNGDWKSNISLLMSASKHRSMRAVRR